MSFFSHLFKKKKKPEEIRSNQNQSQPTQSKPQATTFVTNSVRIEIRKVEKDCGHSDCDLDCSDSCCECGDKRPYQAFYEEYIDGKGFIQSASRHAFYCPACRKRIEEGGTTNRKKHSSKNSKSNNSDPSMHSSNQMQNGSIFEQRAIKEAVRLGYPQSQAIRVARNLPDKYSIQTAEEYLSKLLDAIYEDNNSQQPHVTQPPSRTSASTGTLLSQNQGSSKQCGHSECELACNDTCCQCGDKRPMQAFYEEYVDGKGIVKSTVRHAFYCPSCRRRVANASRTQPPRNQNSVNINSAVEPYCPHSIYPTQCRLCVDAALTTEQRAVKDAVRMGFSLTQVTKAARTIPNKNEITSVQDFVLAILDALQRKPSAQPTVYPTSALVHNSQVSQPSAPQPEPSEESDECKVCFEASVNSVLIPCGHLALCYSCALHIMQSSKKCPICRMDVKSAVQTFKA